MWSPAPAFQRKRGGDLFVRSPPLNITEHSTLVDGGYW
jgi:hypothetical protein